MRRKRLLLYAAMAVYLAVLLRITVFRSGFAGHGLFSGRVEWVPFVYLAKLLRVGYYRYFCYLFFGNLLWFVPLGACVRLLGGRWYLAALLGLGLSLFIELSQFFLGSGVTETEDLILNTAGALLGFCLPIKKNWA